MNQSKPNNSRQPNPKIRKVNKKTDQFANSADIAKKENQTADILKLDIDCCEEAFDYLPFEDLVSVGKTCKRLQQVAGYCFHQNYSSNALCYSDRISGYEDFIQHDVSHFAAFIRKIMILRGEGLKYFFNTRSNFRQLKQIHIIQLKSTDLDLLKEVLMGKLEFLRVFDCDFGKHFHEIIDQCTNLKRLEIECYMGECDWLDGNYPKLEHFAFIPRLNRGSVSVGLHLYDSAFIKKANLGSNSIERIPMFLEFNQNIRKFATTSLFLWEFRNKMIKANIKLDVLAIQHIHAQNVKFISIANLLNKLYERGFYKKLHLYFDKIENQEEVNRLATVDGLVRLFEWQIGFIPLKISALKNIEELFLSAIGYVVDLEMVVDNFVNLKCITFLYASIDDIMPFIKRSVELRAIKIKFLEAGVFYDKDSNIIDLLALNRVREKLPDAQKITLYVKEEIYLSTKWAKKETDFGLIRLKRKELFQWHEDFAF